MYTVLEVVSLYVSYALIDVAPVSISEWDAATVLQRCSSVRSCCSPFLGI